MRLVPRDDVEAKVDALAGDGRAFGAAISDVLRRMIVYKMIGEESIDEVCKDGAKEAEVRFG